MQWVRMCGDEVAEVYETTKTHLGPLRRGVAVSQRFVAERDGLCGLTLLVATYGGPVESKATLVLLDAEGREELRRCELPTGAMADNAWEAFLFEPVRDSAGRVFHFRLETDAEGAAITVWANDTVPPRGACRRSKGLAGEDELAGDDVRPRAGACFRCQYVEDVSSLLDVLLFPAGGHAAPPVPPESRRVLHDVVAACIKAKGLYFLRLAHLADAVGRARGVRRILSVGCGEAMQEAFLAARFPDAQVVATDLFLLGKYRFVPPNLRFERRNILEWDGEPEGAAFDFVFSIECLEHIKDYPAAFRNIAAKVRPGGHLYVSVPFASAGEQRDESLCRYEWEQHEHFVPGFTFDDLEGLMAAAGFEVVHASNMFRVALAVELNGLLAKMPAASVDAALGEAGRLFLTDVDGRRVESRAAGSHGVRVLGRRR